MKLSWYGQDLRPFRSDLLAFAPARNEILLSCLVNYSVRKYGMGAKEEMDLLLSREALVATVGTIKPYALALLVFTGLLLELVVHYQLKISIAYTHFFYLIIAIAGLWYGKKAIPLALFFGGLQIAVGWLISGSITPDSLVRAAMFFVVAYIIGYIADTLNSYYAMVGAQNRDLREVNERLAASEHAFQTANRKLNLLSSVTRHDIRNQLSALLSYLELSRMQVTDPVAIARIEKERTAAHAIERQLDFMKTYEEIGVVAPQWQDIRSVGERLRARLPHEGVTLTLPDAGTEVYADPLLEKVFENLADNSLRHGERVKQITISAWPDPDGGLALVYQDDGVGIRNEDKERVFVKGFGKNTGLGMFLSREILAITDLTISENGVYGVGVRFEIRVPEGKHRIVVASG